MTAPTSMDVAEAVTIRGLSKDFGDRTVLRDVDLDIAAGEFVAIVGESGSGKSTLLRIIAGLEESSGGDVRHVEPVAVGFQDSRLIPWFRVWRNVVFGIVGKFAQLRERASEALIEVGLADYAGAWPSTLSGGQAQRVSLARALIVRPRLLLLDEPFGALDALTKLKMQALVSRLWAEHGFAIALVTHDIDEAVVLADRIVVVANGRIAEEVVVDLPRPRRHTDHHVADLKARVLSLLGIDDLAE